MNAILNPLMWIIVGMFLATAVVYVLSLKGMILIRRCSNPERTLPQFNKPDESSFWKRFPKRAYTPYCTYCHLDVRCRDPALPTLWVQKQPFCSYVCIGREYERRYNQ